jgi:hypothetical protein
MNDLTLTDKYSYDSAFVGFSLDEFIYDLNNSEENPKKILNKRTYTFDIYTTIVHVTMGIFLNNKEHMRSYIRGELDADIYVENIHKELVELYLCFKNTSNEEKSRRGFYLKKIDKEYRNDLYTTYYDNLDEMFYSIYLNYINIILKKTTEKILLNGIENL